MPGDSLPFPRNLLAQPLQDSEDTRTRDEGGSRGGKETAGEPERRGNSRLRYIFRTVPNAVVTRRCHCARHPELPLAPHHAATASRGTAPDTPLSNESTQFDGARGAVSLHLGPPGASASSLFPPSLPRALAPSLSLSLLHPYGCSFIPAPPSLSPPLARNERERESAPGRTRARARARDSPPSPVRPFDLASLLSLSLASLVPSWSLLRRLVAASRTPFPLRIRST